MQTIRGGGTSGSLDSLPRQGKQAVDKQKVIKMVDRKMAINLIEGYVELVYANARTPDDLEILSTCATETDLDTTYDVKAFLFTNLVPGFLNILDIAEVTLDKRTSTVPETVFLILATAPSPFPTLRDNKRTRACDSAKARAISLSRP